MSNHNPNEKLEPRKSKVSVALAINHGLVGPKAMAKAEADGQQVNTPAQPYSHIWGTKEISSRALLVWHSCSKASVERGRMSGFYRANASEEPSEKNPVKRLYGFRTVNRHWWVRREA